MFQHSPPGSTPPPASSPSPCFSLHLPPFCLLANGVTHTHTHTQNLVSLRFLFVLPLFFSVDQSRVFPFCLVFFLSWPRSRLPEATDLSRALTRTKDLRDSTFTRKIHTELLFLWGGGGGGHPDQGHLTFFHIFFSVYFFTEMCGHSCCSQPWLLRSGAKSIVPIGRPDPRGGVSHRADRPQLHHSTLLCRSQLSDDECETTESAELGAALGRLSRDAPGHFKAGLGWQ